MLCLVSRVSWVESHPGQRLFHCNALALQGVHTHLRISVQPPNCHHLQAPAWNSTQLLFLRELRVVVYCISICMPSLCISIFHCTSIKKNPLLSCECKTETTQRGVATMHGILEQDAYRTLMFSKVVFLSSQEMATH